MAFPASFISPQLLRDVLKGVITTAKIAAASTPDVLKVALYSNAVTATIDTDPNSYNVAGWSGNECTHTGGSAPWPTGGVTLAGATLAESSGLGIVFDATRYRL
jgi:hypothetical protein